MQLDNNVSTKHEGRQRTHACLPLRSTGQLEVGQVCERDGEKLSVKLSTSNNKYALYIDHVTRRIRSLCPHIKYADID